MYLRYVTVLLYTLLNKIKVNVLHTTEPHYFTGVLGCIVF